MYGRGLIYLYLCHETGRASVRRELSFCPDHVVVGQPHCAMMVYASAPRRRTEVQFALWVAFGWALEAVFFGC